MKVLIVNTHDIQGGAARAANRLHKGLRRFGIDSHMLVQIKSGQDFTVLAPQTKFGKIAAKVRPLIDRFGLRKYKNKTQTLFSQGIAGDSGLVERINSLAPDIVHLHWVNEGFLSISDISKIKAPIVWSLHDMWPFTGGCHYDEWCGAYSKNCGSCKVLGSKRAGDLSSRVFKLKRKAYAKANITVIGLSNWLANEAGKSQLFSGRTIVNLPNPIDQNEFFVVDQNFARQLFNLPLDKKLILFGAMGATADQRKGFQQLSEALALLNDDYELVVFGSEAPKTAQGFKQKAHYLGMLNDNVSLKALYNAADVMLVPSLQENLSNAIMESLACGTPVVAFDIGGNGDMITHQQNGYLAKPFDTSDLARGIEEQLGKSEHVNRSQKISNDTYARFEVNAVVPRYIDLYQSIMDANKVG
jgi:glycosyltransferase involved in cell wall biosynthesis